MQKIVLSILLLLVFLKTFSQHGQEDHSSRHGHEAPYQKITLVMANSLITNRVTENAEGIFVIPTFGVNYDYFFHKRWGIGVHTDIILQQFKIERHNNKQEIVRQNPIALCGILSFKPHPRLIFMGGYGIELEKNENINLFRFGLEYGIPLPDNWELGIGAEYDHKINAYSSIMFGVAFSKLLFKK